MGVVELSLSVLSFGVGSGLELGCSFFLFFSLFFLLLFLKIKFSFLFPHPALSLPGSDLRVEIQSAVKCLHRSPHGRCPRVTQICVSEGSPWSPGEAGQSPPGDW